MMWFLLVWCTCALAARLQQGKVEERVTRCHRGMHLRLDEKLSDRHAVNPAAIGDAEQHVILSKDLNAGESESGWCSDLVFYADIFLEEDEEFWDPDSTAWDFLYGTIEVSCEQDDGKPYLKVVQNSCRELLPFSTIWEHDTAETAISQDRISQFEYAEFTCGDPLTFGSDLLRIGAVKPLQEASNMDEAQSLCDAEPKCKAIAVKDGKFRLLDGFSCPFFAAEAFHTSFHAGEEVELRVQGREKGKVLESWSLEDQDPEVLVQFTNRAQYVLPEHLAKGKVADSWTVLRKIRERKATCENLEPHTSCDIYSKAVAEQLDVEATPSSCRQACLQKMEGTPHLQRCCVLSDSVCALTRGEHFLPEFSEEEKEKHPVEWAGGCYQQPCSADPTCSMGDYPNSSRLEAVTGPVRFFDFAHPFAPYHVDTEQHTIYHFAGTPQDPRVAAALQDQKRQLRAVGQGPQAGPKASFGQLHNLRFSKRFVHEFQENIGKTCETLGQGMGRKLLPPDLEVALAECRDGHLLQTCLMKQGCLAQSNKDKDHEWLPFSPSHFPQLPYDILAWQTPAAFCCAASYTLDVRKEEMLKVMEEMTDVKMDLTSRVEDEGMQKSLKDSVKSGSQALKKMLMHHVSDSSELNWLSQLVRTALEEFKKLLNDLEDTVDTEATDDVEISEDGQAFIQVGEHGNATTPSGRRGTVIARWSPEQGAFLQTAEPPSTLRKAANLVASVPGAIYHYGVRPLWNYVAKPLLKMGLSLTKWILEHPRAALFISKFGVLMRDRLCEKVSWHMYGDPGETAVGALAYASNSATELHAYMKKTFSPAVMLTGLKEIMQSSSMMNSLADMGRFSFSLLLSWTGIATGGAAFALIGTMTSLLAEAGLEAGRRAMELMIYQEIAKEIPSNLFDMLGQKCLYKREAVQKVTWNSTKEELLSTGKDAIETVTNSVQSAGAALSEQMNRWSNFLGSMKNPSASP